MNKELKLADLEVEIKVGREQVVIPGEYPGYKRYIKDIDFGIFNTRDIETDIDNDNFITVEDWLANKIDIDEHDYNNTVTVFKDVIVKGDLIYEDSWWYFNSRENKIN